MMSVAFKNKITDEPGNCKLREGGTCNFTSVLITDRPTDFRRKLRDKKLVGSSRKAYRRGTRSNKISQSCGHSRTCTVRIQVPQRVPDTMKVAPSTAPLMISIFIDIVDRTFYTVVATLYHQRDERETKR